MHNSNKTCWCSILELGWITFNRFPDLHLYFRGSLSLNGNHTYFILWLSSWCGFNFIHQETVIVVSKVTLRPVVLCFELWKTSWKEHIDKPSSLNHCTYNISHTVCLPGQILQHFPSIFMGSWHGYWLGHVMRLHSWKPSLQVHRMHSKTFPSTGCHTSPWEYVLPLYTQA